MPTELVHAPRHGILETIGGSIKALTGSRKVPFANIQGSGYGGYGGGNYNLGNWGAHQGGSALDYGTLAGNLLENRVVAAGANAIAIAVSSVPPILEKKNGDKWERLDHECIDRLLTPNDFYGSAQLESATAGDDIIAGQAFWRMERSKSKTSVAEIWWEKQDRFRVLGDAGRFISGYEFRAESGDMVKLDNDDVIHFRHSLNPMNPRQGWSPLMAGLRQVAGDNAAASYTASILRNAGVMSLMVSPKDATAGAMITPDQVTTVLNAMKQKLFGEGAGGIFGLNVPLNVEKMSYSPDEMAIEKIQQYYVVTLCALIGVDPMVLGLHTEAPTYANFAEANKAFYLNRVMPYLYNRGSTLRAQYLPLWGLDPAEYRIAYDKSGVEPLQEDVDQLHTRTRENYKAGFISMFDARSAVGLETDDSMKAKFAGGGGEDAEDESTPDVAAKSADWDESKHSRADDGTFGSGGAPRSKWHKNAMELIDGALEDGGVTDNQKRLFSQSADNVLGNMTEANRHAFYSAVEDISFHGNAASLTARLSIDFGEVFEDGEESGGCFARKGDGTGTLYLNGGGDGKSVQEIYAHEFAHVLDRQPRSHSRISDTADWKSAWQSEIVGNLSEYAGTDASEGFAEFGRLALGDAASQAKAKKDFPQCSAVWNENVTMREYGT